MIKLKVKTSQLVNIKKNSLTIIDEGINYPFIGGNKIRKILGILGKNKFYGLMTYGSKYSSHCIAAAYWGMKNEVPVRLLIIEDNELDLDTYPTIKISKFFGASVVQIKSLNASDRIAQEKQKYSSYRWIAGGCHEYGGFKAYSEWFSMLLDSFPDLAKRDWIILPYGTGTTALGLLDAVNKAKLNLKIIGVSVSRDKKRCYEAAADFVEKDDMKKLDIVDQFSGKYGLIESSHRDLRLDFFEKTGILVDPIYNIRTIEYLEDKKLTNGIIINTGGQHNNYL